MKLKQEISEKTEDYLEAIFLLTSKYSVARVRDIAEIMDVTMSTVTNTLKKLSGKGLINYDKYQMITLTEEGTSVAESTLRKHQILSDFLYKVLDVDKEKADENACQLEHHLDEEIIEKLLKFITSIQSCSNEKASCIVKFKNSFKDIKSKQDKENAPAKRKISKLIAQKDKEIITLNNVKTGDEVTISKITFESNAFNRLSDMGLVQGTKIKIINNAPDKDIIEIRLRGYTVSLKKDEALLIEVEKL